MPSVGIDFVTCQQPQNHAGGDLLEGGLESAGRAVASSVKTNISQSTFQVRMLNVAISTVPPLRISCEILSKVMAGSKSGGLFFNSMFELNSRQYVGNQFRAVESLKASLGALA